MRNATDMELSRIDDNHSFCLSLKYDGKFKEKEKVYAQVAILHTDQYGQRKIRLHNLCLGVSNNPATIFKGADLDACITLMLKSGNGKVHLIMSHVDVCARNMCQAITCIFSR